MTFLLSDLIQVTATAEQRKHVPAGFFSSTSHKWPHSCTGGGNTTLQSCQHIAAEASCSWCRADSPCSHLGDVWALPLTLPRLPPPAWQQDCVIHSLASTSNQINPSVSRCCSQQSRSSETPEVNLSKAATNPWGNPNCIRVWKSFLRTQNSLSLIPTWLLPHSTDVSFQLYY